MRSFQPREDIEDNNNSPVDFCCGSINWKENIGTDE